MKKALFLLSLPFLALYLHAQEIEMPNRNIFIEGTAAVSSHRTFFMDNFKMEATSLGFNVVNSREEAGYTFKYDAVRDGNDYMLLINLILNEEDREIVSFGWPYSDINEMYEYNQFVFFKAVVLIPGIDEGELRALMDQAVKQAAPDIRWRNKLVYLRASFDFPITFYQLLPEGLISGKGAYDGSFDNPTRTAPLDNKAMALPGITLGIEVQPLSFLSIEPKISINLEHLNDIDYLIFAAGINVKYQLKLKSNVLLSPYGSFTYPIFLFEDDAAEPNWFNGAKKVFVSFPTFGIGGGVQLNMKAGSSGAFFIDINYMFYIGEAGVHNYLGALYPNPDPIKYQRTVIGIGVGYKFGLFDRKQQK